MSDPRALPDQSGPLGGYNREEAAACDDCAWVGENRRAAAAHHRTTGHNCHAERHEQFLYGDPLASFLRNQGMTPGRSAAPAASDEFQPKEDR